MRPIDKLVVRRIQMRVGATDAPNPACRKAFLWFDADHEDRFEAYKLPIVDVWDGELRIVPRAVFSAAALIAGARDDIDIPEADRDAVKANIARYYACLGMESGSSATGAGWCRRHGGGKTTIRLNAAGLAQSQAVVVGSAGLGGVAAAGDGHIAGTNGGQSFVVTGAGTIAAPFGVRSVNSLSGGSSGAGAIGAIGSGQGSANTFRVAACLPTMRRRWQVAGGSGGGGGGGSAVGTQGSAGGAGGGGGLGGVNGSGGQGGARPQAGWVATRRSRACWTLLPGTPRSGNRAVEEVR